MTKFRMIALTKPVAGREDEFNDWYQNTHLPQICALPGVQGAQRYRQAAVLQNGDDRSYLAIYDIDTDDIGQTLAAFGEASAAGRLTPGDAMDPAGYTVIFSEFGDRVTSSD